MTKPIAFASLLFIISQLASPAALARSTLPAVQEATPPAPAPATDAAPIAQTQKDDAAQEVVDSSAPGAGDLDEQLVVRGRFVPAKVIKP